MDLPQELIDIKRKARESKQQQIQTGFVAQDVEKTAKSLDYDFSGVDVDENGIYALRYAEFVVPLVKAVQELSEQNDRLQEQVNELTGLVYQLLDKESNSLRSGNKRHFYHRIIANQGCWRFPAAKRSESFRSIYGYPLFLAANFQLGADCYYQYSGKRCSTSTALQHRRRRQRNHRRRLPVGRRLSLLPDLRRQSGGYETDGFNKVKTK